MDSQPKSRTFEDVELWSRFYNIAQGSLEESRYYLILARDLHYGDPAKLIQGASEIGRMLRSYARATAVIR